MTARRKVCDRWSFFRLFVDGSSEKGVATDFDDIFRGDSFRDKEGNRRKFGCDPGLDPDPKSRRSWGLIYKGYEEINFYLKNVISAGQSWDKY